MNVAKAILELRIEESDLPKKMLQQRRRRMNWTRDRLTILAMDHPARRVVAAGGQPLAMANRVELLKRIATVLMQPGIDGLLATPDILEETLLLNALVVQAGGPNFIDDKVLIGSVNRGGLAGVVSEFDDFVTAYTPTAIVEEKLDAAKLLFRLDPDNPDSAKTMKYCVDVLNALEDADVPAFIEPLTSSGSVDDLVRLIGVASGMGYTTAHRWMKLPMVDDMARVAAATTCPIVLLGGSNPGTSKELRERVKRSLDAAPNIRGLMIGRGVLYPSDGANPAEVAADLTSIVLGKPQQVIEWEDIRL